MLYIVTLGYIYIVALFCSAVFLQCLSSVQRYDYSVLAAVSAAAAAVVVPVLCFTVLNNTAGSWTLNPSILVGQNSEGGHLYLEPIREQHSWVSKCCCSTCFRSQASIVLCASASRASSGNIADLMRPGNLMRVSGTVRPARRLGAPRRGLSKHADATSSTVTAARLLEEMHW